MTTDARDPQRPRTVDGSAPAVLLAAISRSRWLVPGVAIATLMGALVVTGVLSVSTVLYIGLFGGMMLMHLGGHGMHGGHADGHARHDADDQATSASDPEEAAAATGQDRPAPESPAEARGPHGCH